MGAAIAGNRMSLACPHHGNHAALLGAVGVGKGSAPPRCAKALCIAIEMAEVLGRVPRLGDSKIRALWGRIRRT